MGLPHRAKKEKVIFLSKQSPVYDKKPSRKLLESAASTHKTLFHAVVEGMIEREEKKRKKRRFW